MRRRLKVAAVTLFAVGILSTGVWYASAGPSDEKGEQTRLLRAKDPVCGMEVNKKGAEARSMTAEHQGKTYYFCSHQCKQQFVNAPQKFLMSDAKDVKSDVKQVLSCKNCGMNREQFAYSRVFVEYDDGGREGFCSIHCASVDIAVNIDKALRRILVGDYRTKELIDAEKAFWVIGGSKPGVMTKRAKWAFKTKEDADAFLKESGGSIDVFDAAMKAAYEDMYQDTNMIRERRAMNRMAMQEGKMPEQTHNK